MWNCGKSWSIGASVCENNSGCVVRLHVKWLHGHYRSEVIIDLPQIQIKRQSHVSCFPPCLFLCALSASRSRVNQSALMVGTHMGWHASKQAHAHEHTLTPRTRARTHTHTTQTYRERGREGKSYPERKIYELLWTLFLEIITKVLDLPNNESENGEIPNNVYSYKETSQGLDNRWIIKGRLKLSSTSSKSC